MDTLFIILIFLIVGLVLIGIPIVVSYFGFKWLKKKGFNKIAVAFPTIILGGLLLYIYFSFYPTEGFYVDEFERNTSLPFPKSGKIKTKDSCFPDGHGKYWASATIELSEEDYLSLLMKIKKDSLFISVSCSEFNNMQNDPFTVNLKPNDISFVFNSMGMEIDFLKDNKTIIFENRWWSKDPN